MQLLDGIRTEKMKRRRRKQQRTENVGVYRHRDLPSGRLPMMMMMMISELNPRLKKNNYLKNGGIKSQVVQHNNDTIVFKSFKMDNTESVKILSQESNSSWNNSQILGIIVALIAIAFTFFFFTIYRKSVSRKNSVLFLGLCEAGKTLIFSRLVYNKFVQTHTSVKENIGEYICGNTTFNIIDIPGHERLRNRYFDQFKPLTRGLVFVIDSLTIQKDIKDVAEFLYHCLTDNYISNNLPPLLILCNKQGETLAKSCNIVKMLLEKEMNILRTTQSNQLESLAKTSNSVFLGREGKDFQFSDLSPMKIEFAECSAINGQDENNFNLKALEEWISTLV